MSFYASNPASFVSRSANTLLVIIYLPCLSAVQVMLMRASYWAGQIQFHHWRKAVVPRAWLRAPSLGGSRLLCVPTGLAPCSLSPLGYGHALVSGKFPKTWAESQFAFLGDILSALIPFDLFNQDNIK